jgi:hypothetical protein
MKETLRQWWVYEVRDRLRTQKIKLQMAVAWRVPRWLVSWCAVRVVCNATQGQYSNQVVPELSAMDALKRW